MGKIVSEMPALEKEYAIVTKLYTIAKDYEVTIDVESLALYQTLAPSFQHLKVCNAAEYYTLNYMFL